MTNTTPCPKCKAETYQGVAGTVAAFYARLDATPITHNMELACVILNRRTYTRDNKGRIQQRRPNQIVYKAAYWPVHAEHQCNFQMPTTQQPASNITTDTEQCPF